MSYSVSSSDNKGASTSKEPELATASGTSSEAGGFINEDMSLFAWDGPENPDEEIADMDSLKSKYDMQSKAKFSKNGIKTFIENLIKNENAENSNLWVSKMDL